LGFKIRKSPRQKPQSTTSVRRSLSHAHGSVIRGTKLKFSSNSRLDSRPCTASYAWNNLVRDTTGDFLVHPPITASGREAPCQWTRAAASACARSSAACAPSHPSPPATHRPRPDPARRPRSERSYRRCGRTHASARLSRVHPGSAVGKPADGRVAGTCSSAKPAARSWPAWRAAV
jgi:hypothetical protein